MPSEQTYGFPTFFLLLIVLVLSCRSGTIVPSGTPTPAERTLDLALRPGMSIGIRSTAFFGRLTDGAVDPDTPGGGRLVTIETLDPGHKVTVSWQGTEEQVVPSEEPTPVTGIGTPTPTPLTEIVSIEGAITATGLEAAHTPHLPFYWQPGETFNDTSLMWLSREAFSELQTTRRTRWSEDVLTKLSVLPLAVIEEIRATTEDRTIHLNAEPEYTSFEVSVNGRTQVLQAIKAYDDFGNEYLILADADNPLIVKFTFNAISTGTIGVDAGIWALIKTVASGYQVVSIEIP